jgi:hypothetical protein
MHVTLPDPTAPLLDLPPRTLGPQPPVKVSADRRDPQAWEGHRIKRRRSASFTVHTDRGRGSYRSRAKADSAAHWVADETRTPVSVVSELTGERWEVSPVRREP